MNSPKFPTSIDAQALAGERSQDVAARLAMRDLRARWEPVGDDRSLHVVVSERGAAFFRGRMASARARAYRYFEGERRRIELEHRGPGYTWRGWWYPRWLVLGILWLVIAGLFVALVVGLFRLFGGAA